MTDADGDPPTPDATPEPARKHKKGAHTLLIEKSEQDRRDREAEISRDDAKDEATLDRLESAYAKRAEAAEKSAILWFRLAIALVGVLAMLVGGVAAVGGGVSIPGIGSFSVNKAPVVEQRAPGVEADNLAEEGGPGEAP